MIKEFLKCATLNERIEFLTNTVMSDWSVSDLRTVMNILGVESDSQEPGAMISAIEKHLADYKHKVMDSIKMDCSKIDSMKVKETGNTLYNEEGVANMLNNVVESLEEE